MKYKLVETKKLRALEMVFPHHLKNLTEMINGCGFMSSPLIVSKKHNIVLDGSHRHIFLLQEGYKYAPVFYVDYDSNDVRVGTHLMHRHIIEGKKGISKEIVVSRGTTGNLYAPRTTRHFFPFRKIDDAEIPLTKLMKQKPRDVSKNIYECDIKTELHHNLSYVAEIEEEIDEIIRYLWEIKETKEYIKKQIAKMCVRK